MASVVSAVALDRALCPRWLITTRSSQHIKCPSHRKIDRGTGVAADPREKVLRLRC